MSKPKKDKSSALRKEYDEQVLLLKTCLSDSPEYSSQLKNVERIHKLLMEEEANKKTLTPDAVLNCITSLVSVGAILKHEELHNITTKALQFIIKGRR